MKVIFLDIDGVLNNYETRDVYRGCTGIDRLLVSNLNAVVVATGAVVVVSSTWRILHTVEELQEILKNYGFRGQVIGKTSQMNNVADRWRRGNEIDEYVKSLGDDLESFVIVDDASSAGSVHPNNFVQTDFVKALTMKHAIQMIRVLNG